jgi:hypothetical protein
MRCRHYGLYKLRHGQFCEFSDFGLQTSDFTQGMFVPPGVVYKFQVSLIANDLLDLISLPIFLDSSIMNNQYTIYIQQYVLAHTGTQAQGPPRLPLPAPGLQGVKL